MIVIIPGVMGVAIFEFLCSFLNIYIGRVQPKFQGFASSSTF